MKKLLKVSVLVFMALALVACGGKDKESGTNDKFEIALITDVGTIDDKSFNQGSWEGVLKYNKEVKTTHGYLRPTRQDDSEYYNTIARAITEGGAKIIVTPGFLFQNAVFRAQTDFPDVHFIFVDALPQEKMDSEPVIGKNTVSLLYEEHQAGFLAGYAAVKDGLTKLGYIGGLRVPAVEKFGSGFVQGAEYAAQELGVDVEIKYNYAGTFEPSTEVNQMAASWYKSGTEVIFHAAGGAGMSVIKAAEDENGKVIGVDTDQSNLSKTIITSAVKELEDSVYRSIKASYEGKFPGGQVDLSSVENDSVGLPQDFSRFTKFDQAQYDVIYNKLKTNEGGIRENIKPLHANDFSDIKLERVKITVI